MFGQSKEPRKRTNSLGVQVTGYLDTKKSGRWRDVWKSRFWVLTHDGLYCFKREEKESSLFGQERGVYFLERVSEVRGAENEPLLFRFDYLPPTSGVKAKTQKMMTVTLRASNPQECLMWQKAIEEALADWKRKMQWSQTEPHLVRRGDSVVGDFRNPERHWPSITSVVIQPPSNDHDDGGYLPPPPPYDHADVTKTPRNGNRVLPASDTNAPSPRHPHQPAHLQYTSTHHPSHIAYWTSHYHQHKASGRAKQPQVIRRKVSWGETMEIGTLGQPSGEKAEGQEEGEEGEAQGALRIRFDHGQ